MHPWVVKIGCNVVVFKFSSIDPTFERHISSKNVPSRTSKFRYLALAISHTFEDSRITHAPLAVLPFIPPTSPRPARVQQSTIDGIFPKS